MANKTRKARALAAITPNGYEIRGWGFAEEDEGHQGVRDGMNEGWPGEQLADGQPILWRWIEVELPVPDHEPEGVIQGRVEEADHG